MDDGFDTKGLEDITKDIVEAANEFPGTAEKHLRRVGNKMKKMLKDASSDSGYKHKKKLKDSWKSEVVGYNGAELRYDIGSESPHFHLVEYGHRQVTRSGVFLRFVPGTHFLEKTAQEVEKNVAPVEMDKFFKDITKKIGG